MEPDHINLAIAIPTFNRSSHLKARVEKLLPQLSSRVRLYIFDNFSTDETWQILQKIESPYLFKRQSPTNLGMSANIIRCFVEIKADWLWILGDDDRPKEDCVNTALSLIHDCKHSLINTTSTCNATEADRSVTGLGALLREKNVTDLMHLSTNLYRTKDFLESFKVLCPAGVTMAPHVALIFHAVFKRSLSALLSSQSLLDEVPSRRRFSSSELAIGLSTLPLLVPPKFRRAVAKSIRSGTSWMLMWALKEIRTIEDFKEWKYAVRLVRGTLSLHGATSLSLVFTALPVRERLRSILITLFCCAPFSIVKAYGARKRIALANWSDETLTDFN